jgi:hypothetical protein
LNVADELLKNVFYFTLKLIFFYFKGGRCAFFEFHFSF